MLFEEYNILKNRIEKIGEELYDKRNEFNNSSLPVGQGRCFYECVETLPAYSDWEALIEVNTSVKCPEMWRTGGCAKTDCPGYKNYKEYIKIKKRFDSEYAKLEDFPFLSLINQPRIK